MSIVVGLIFIALVAVVPVMIAAKMLKAGNSGFLNCFGTVILVTIATHISREFFAENVLGYLISLVIAACVFMLVLDARFLQSVGISILSLLIQIAGILALASIYE